MTASQELARTVRKLTVESKHQPASDKKDDIIAALVKRVDAGGMVLVDSDLYPVNPLNIELADIVLPAAAWGEHDGARCNGERRLRLYAKFYDAPGGAKPDWWAVAKLAKAMGFTGYDWTDDNAVFEKAARFSRGDVLDYYPLVWKAQQDGKKGHDPFDPALHAQAFCSYRGPSAGDAVKPYKMIPSCEAMYFFGSSATWSGTQTPMECLDNIRKFIGLTTL